MNHKQLVVPLASLVLVGLVHTRPAAAEQTRPAPAPRPATARKIGLQGLATAGLTFPVAKESFEAAGLDKRGVEFGGGAQVTDLWRNLFVEVSASRWSSDGERVFLDDDGTRFSLGIPLSVKTTHIDVSAGWRARGQGLSTLLGGGVGSVAYSETSPFAQNDDDLDVRKTSYHVLVGVEVPIRRWLAISGELRYRWVPGLLGDGGVSAVLDEDRFGGAQTAVGLRLGFGGAKAPVTKRPATPAPAAKPAQGTRDPRLGETSRNTGVTIESAPVFLLPDPTRKPLRTLDAGTSLKILQQTGDWLRVEFNDRQFGPRQGYIQRKYVRVGQGQ